MDGKLIRKGKRLFVLVLMVLAGASCQAKTDPVATLKGDVMTIANGKAEFVFRWNGGDPVPVSVRKGDAFMEFRKSGKNPSGLQVSGFQGKMTGGKFSVKMIKNQPGINDHLAVTAEGKIGKLGVRRVYRLYPEASALLCDFYLKGQGTKKALASVTADGGPTGVENPKASKSKHAGSFSALFDIPGSSLNMRSVKFYGATDHNDNLVEERDILAYKTVKLHGNLLLVRNKVEGKGIFIYKKSPLREADYDNPGYDFLVGRTQVKVAGLGVPSAGLSAKRWSKGYGVVFGLADSDSELDMLLALRDYQKAERFYNAADYDMVMMNTWGDRSRDSRMNEKFILAELEKCKKLGITHFQLDDGWQKGLSHNSSVKGGNKSWDKWSVDDWTPHPERFPNGFEPVVKKAKALGVRLGLWFNASSKDNYATWENDADILIGLYKKHGVRYFKIDGMMISSKKGEENFMCFFNKVVEETNGEVIFNMDVTAGKRFGYHVLDGNSNIFLENRYTDWTNYFPHRTLRNLWTLSRYFPPEGLQVEFLNKWRNAKKYGDNPLAPSNIPFDYCFATTMMGQPLAWFEASGLPAEAMPVAKTIKAYNKESADIHAGAVLPIGEEPSGTGWTGFQSIADQRTGYVLVMREFNDKGEEYVKTWLPEGKSVKFEAVLGAGKSFEAVAERNGEVRFALPKAHSFALYRYKVSN
ncbi:hypothetical protein FUAX_35140 [Fulvitalea axinellae]|uniref:Alpha-galactosidase n=1 Tax=Fulvitalea axinellae TaxID=1182444 RepID=A0AAU9CSV1_9BACT|nr:hypothetical protein FUAX_35140 [Fulvitalea axinellae]